MPSLLLEKMQIFSPAEPTLCCIGRWHAPSHQRASEETTGLEVWDWGFGIWDGKSGPGELCCRQEGRVRVKGGKGERGNPPNRYGSAHRYKIRYSSKE